MLSSPPIGHVWWHYAMSYAPLFLLLLQPQSPWSVPVLAVAIACSDFLVGPTSLANKRRPVTFTARERYHFELLLRVWPLVFFAASIRFFHDLAISQNVSVGHILSTGLMFSQAALIGHELMHSRNATNRRLAGVLIVPCVNPAYLLHHTNIHHKRVGLPDDAATASLGTNVYAFSLRMNLGQFEAVRRNPALRTRLPRMWAIIFVCATIIYLTLGPAALFVYIAGRILGTFLFNAGNYIEHYGLRRETSEPIALKHSWDSPPYMSNCTLFHIGAHAHHHANPTKPYYELTPGIGPVHPFGFLAMIFLSCVPPLWRHVMDERAEAVNREWTPQQE